MNSKDSRSSEAYRLRIKTDVADLYHTQATDLGARLKQQAREIGEAIKKPAQADNKQPVDDKQPKAGLTARQMEALMQPVSPRVQEIDAYCAKPENKLNQQCQQYNDLKNAQRQKIEKAKTYYTEVLSIAEKTLLPNHPNLAKLYNSLGKISQEQGETDEANRLLSLGDEDSVN